MENLEKIDYWYVENILPDTSSGHKRKLKNYYPRNPKATT